MDVWILFLLLACVYWLHLLAVVYLIMLHSMVYIMGIQDIYYMQILTSCKNNIIIASAAYVSLISSFPC